MSEAARLETNIRVTFSEVPPSANAMRAHAVNGGKVVSFKSRPYAAWKEAAVWEVAAQRVRKVDGPYVIAIAVQRDHKSKRARDIDNTIKPISDALVAAGVVKDDSLCERVSAEWSDDLGGCAVVAIVQAHTPLMEL